MQKTGFGRGKALLDNRDYLLPHALFLSFNTQYVNLIISCIAILNNAVLRHNEIISVFAY